MKNIVKIITAKLLEYWHVPVGALFALLSLWAGALFLHFCPACMEVPGVITTSLLMLCGVVLACMNVDWTRQY